MSTPTTGATPPVAEGARRDVPEFVRAGERLMWIGGRQVPGSSGERLVSVDPTTEEELAGIVRGTAGDVDAIAKANQTEYGLAASVWTKDLNTAHRVADGIDAGTIWINTHHEMTTGPMPFAGFKQSGVGGEGGPEVLDAFTKHKAILVAL